MISKESRFIAGFLLVVLPSVLYGGLFLLSQLVDDRSGYMANPLRQNLFRAGHVHAGVLLVLSLIALRYVDEANLSPLWKWIVRIGIPSAAIFYSVAKRSLPITSSHHRSGARLLDEHNSPVLHPAVVCSPGICLTHDFVVTHHGGSREEAK